MRTYSSDLRGRLKVWGCWQLPKDMLLQGMVDPLSNPPRMWNFSTDVSSQAI